MTKRSADAMQAPVDEDENAAAAPEEDVETDEYLDIEIFRARLEEMKGVSFVSLVCEEETYTDLLGLFVRTVPHTQAHLKVDTTTPKPTFCDGCYFVMHSPDATVFHVTFSSDYEIETSSPVLFRYFRTLIGRMIQQDKTVKAGNQSK